MKSMARIYHKRQTRFKPELESSRDEVSNNVRTVTYWELSIAKLEFNEQIKMRCYKKSTKLSTYTYLYICIYICILYIKDCLCCTCRLVRAVVALVMMNMVNIYIYI